MAGIKEMLHKPVFEQLGESQVRIQYSSQTDDVGREARSWLHELQLQRDLEASAKRDAREEATLSIANEANRLASEANTIARLESASASRSARYAMYAAVIAAIGTIIAAKNEIYALIFKL